LGSRARLRGGALCPRQQPRCPGCYGPWHRGLSWQAPAERLAFRGDWGEFALPLPFLAEPAWRLAGMAPFLAGCAIVLGLGVIRREESYLERKFADEYRAYKARVGRWL
ncbi:MAG: hypothetical protein MI920_19885, partial [Kiloniellales bacterium]|nr:hypothetical protein [Kiloniellales bacterium]